MDEKEMKAFGLYLRRLRERAGLTLREAEGRSNVSNGYISLLENGLRKAPHPDKLRGLAEAYGVPFADLMRGAGYIDESDELLSEDAKLDLLYQHALDDPAFQFGTRITGEVTKEIKRFIVELYQNTRKR